MEEIEYSLITANQTLAVIAVEGNINFDTSEDLYEFVIKILDREDSKTLIFDLHGVQYVSSAGVGVFMSLYERLESAGGKILLVGVSASFHRVMELLGCLDYFQFSASMDDAKNYLIHEL